jgi:hypothetical protein
MRKDFSIRLRMTAVEGEQIKKIALREGRSQTDTLNRIVRDGLKFRRGEVSELVRIFRGEVPTESTQ